MAAIHATFAGNTAAMQMGLGNLDPYESRGKGRGGVFLGSSKRTVAMAKREATKARNRRKEKART